MHRYVAFLRGINVGGRVVVKTTLQKAFASMGYQNVSTFKQSGNVIFEASEVDSTKLKADIEGSLHAVLGYEVAVFIRTITQLRTIIEADPFREQPSEGSSFLITLLESSASFSSPLPIAIPKSTAQVIAADGTEVYSVTHGGGEGALPNPFMEKQLGVKATTRNINVIREIVKRYG
jgi:uncharacterized protein (DUF1697 family)